MKKQLIKIRENDFSIPIGFDERSATELVLNALRSTDGELRDDLGYTILSKWIVEKERIGPETLKKLLKQAIAEKMLFHKIGEQDSDSVFLRSFSSLLIALIFYRDNQEHFLSREEFKQILLPITHYCTMEKDYRSFVIGKGWAHAPAHISDAMDECAKNRFATSDDCLLLLQSIRTILYHAPNVFEAEEDERLATVVISMIRVKKIEPVRLLRWLTKINLEKPEVLTAHSSVAREHLTKRINMKHFLRCLYIRFSGQSLLNAGELKKLFDLEHKYNPNFFNN
ncbi:MAG: DUF2785 domain-containing protein [Sporolactobacillus sp.]